MGLVGVAKKGWQDREREEVFFEAWKGEAEGERGRRRWAGAGPARSGRSSS